MPNAFDTGRMPFVITFSKVSSLEKQNFSMDSFKARIITARRRCWFSTCSTDIPPSLDRCWVTVSAPKANWSRPFCFAAYIISSARLT
jgi:hypothetical protein